MAPSQAVAEPPATAPSLAVVSAWSHDYAVGYACWSLTAAYARRHGYATRARVLPTWEMLSRVGMAKKPSLTWFKTVAVSEALEELAHDWVLWVDADAFPLRPERSLESVLRAVGATDAHELVVAKDLTQQCRINGGVLLVRNTSFTRGLFRVLWSDASQRGLDFISRNFHEQSALERVMLSHAPAVWRVDRRDWHRPGSYSFGRFLVVDKELLNCNEAAACQWIFHGAGRAKHALPAALRAAGYPGDEDDAALGLWRAKPLRQALGRLEKAARGPAALQALAARLRGSPYAFLDLSGMIGLGVVAGDLEELLRGVVPSSRVEHLVLSNNKGASAGAGIGSIDLAGLLLAWPQLLAVEAANVELSEAHAAALLALLEHWPDALPAGRRVVDISRSLAPHWRDRAAALLEHRGFSPALREHMLYATEALFLERKGALLIL
jgi:hypothetical protein